MPEFQEEQLRTKAMGGELHEQATARVKKLAKKILSISAIIGVLQSVLSLIPTYVFPGIFAQDKLVVQEVKNQAFNLALAIFPHCITIAIEALLLNSKDLDFLGGAYIVKSVLWTVTLKHFADQHANLNVLWKGMMALQYIRALVWTLRLILSGKKLGIPIYSRKSRKQRVQMSKESPV
ncbi:hypothetical protein GUITHDRAFT_118356 [Guillardia theta CCMP2712]|uniref:Uncharacterized protein n=1 Tax=Guillardia theta (strain CCMP2712) TaxID=905079 RepID=L1II03_GUITC|nr:hypothetical protein GUITHDRAFT_118356 [Guillardia theta CCMP2712]EKX35440.1 hypothetical protein GUITHDRAFT_118356 [Guillardia theta CCMP2712]|eukprot:XP_005822420.1 hypothetical protein GUITHDRAFT_118356 [Guillardia theta CCMP2712]